MRILSIVCGIAVIIMSLHFVHFLHHFIIQPPHEAQQALVYWGGVSLAVVMDILSFIGGCLLLKRGR
jgi:Na+-driven multidrug efflux pump